MPPCKSATNAGKTYTGKQAWWYENDSTMYAPMNYGLLYNWNAAVDTFNTAYGETSVNTSSSNALSVTFNDHRRGICPVGWHLPNEAEWTAMIDYVSSQSEYFCEGRTSYIGKALADNVGWNTYSGECYPSDQSEMANNATGFSAVPAGYCGGTSFSNAMFSDAGNNAYFWSATQLNSATQPSSYLAYSHYLVYYSAGVSCYYFSKGYGYSVRCLRD